MYVQVLPQERWPHSLKTPMPQVDFPTGMQHWHSTRVQGVQGERLLTRKVTTFSTIYIYIYILTWTFQPQQTFHQALPECWRVWQVVVEGMSHTCQCNTGCSKYLSSGVKGPCSMAAIRFYSPVSVLLIMVLHSQAKLGSGIICSCSMSWKASIWLLISWLENTQSLNSACYPHGCGIPELLHLKLLSGILSSFRMITWSLKGILSFQSRRE